MEVLGSRLGRSTRDGFGRHAHFEQKPLNGTKMDNRRWVTDGQKYMVTVRRNVLSQKVCMNGRTPTGLSPEKLKSEENDSSFRDIRVENS